MYLSFYYACYFVAVFADTVYIICIFVLVTFDDGFVDSKIQT